MSRRNKIFRAVSIIVLLAVLVLGLSSQSKSSKPDADREVSENTSAQLEEEREKGNHPNEAEEEDGDKGDHPNEAIQFRALSLKDENGFIPPDGLIVAQRKMKAMQAAQPMGAEAIDKNSWTWLGPGNIGGRVRAIVIHPSNPNIMWVGSASGGIWKTTDGGASWQIQDDFMSNMAVSTMVIDPTDPNILYAGTGEGFFGGGSGDVGWPRGGGVFKTTNGGTTWTQLASTNNSNWYFVNRLAISPANHLILLAATTTGVFKSSDGGTSWNLVSAPGKFSLDVNFNPSDGSKAVVGGDLGNAWYSTNSGDSWNLATFLSMGALNGSGRVEVAYAPSNPNIVYASVKNNIGEIWKSVDGGQTYTKVSTGQTKILNYPWDRYADALWVDPTNSNTIIVGEMDLFRSTNGGVTLTQISQWWNAPASAHADHHMIIEKPGFNGTSNTTVFFGNDGGIYRANNVYTVIGTSGWTELNNNLGITQFYGAAGNASTGTIIGGTQDNGTLTYTPAGGTEGWTFMLEGDGGWSAADQTDPNYFYGEYIYANVYRNDHGATSRNYTRYISGYDWNGSGYVSKSPPYIISDVANQTANFIAPIILDPNNANRLLVGGASLWRTDNVKAALTSTTGPVWTAIKPPISGFQNYISAIVVAPGNSDIIWVGYDQGEVYKTTNGTAGSPTWTQVDLNTPNLPNRYATRITIDSGNSNIVYVTFGGFSADNVWRTTNGGTNWNDITGSGLTGLPNLPVRSLVINPSNSNNLIIGTELGVFESLDGGANWTLPHSGPTNTPVDELFWMGNTLVAATHGRGLFSQVPVTPNNVTISGNAGTTGVTLSYDNGTKAVTSKVDGTYSLTVPSGWNGTVIPSHPCFSFDPPQNLYNNVTGNLSAQDYSTTFDGSSGCAHVFVTIGALSAGEYGLLPATSTRAKYPGVNNGPMAVTGDLLVASQRALFGGKSFSETMGYPNSLLTDTYIFPYYNNMAMNSQLRVTNLGNVDTTISVYLGSNFDLIDQYTLSAGMATRKNYTGQNDGPLVVVSSDTNILTTIRVVYNTNSYSELTGFPANQLTNVYLFPYYNNVAMNSQLRVTNLGDVDTTITVLLAGSPIDQYTLPAGMATRKNYTGQNDGPLVVVSSDTNILSSVRVLYGASFSELMGFPASQLDYEYWFPIYDNNASLNSQLRIGNIGNGPTTINVYVGSTQIDSYTLDAGQATRKNYAQSSGPLHIVSSDQPILTSVRLIYNTASFASFYEITGLPNAQLDTQVWFPWYNNFALDTVLRFAVP